MISESDKEKFLKIRGYIENEHYVVDSLHVFIKQLSLVPGWNVIYNKGLFDIVRTHKSGIKYSFFSLKEPQVILVLKNHGFETDLALFLSEEQNKEGFDLL